jgi:hypothetical protein
MICPKSLCEQLQNASCIPLTHLHSHESFFSSLEKATPAFAIFTITRIHEIDNIIWLRGGMFYLIFSDLQVAIRRTEHLELGPGHPLAGWINQSARTLHEAGIETEIHRVPGHTTFPGNEDADRQANLAREGRRTGTVRERVYTSAANRNRRISEAKTVAKAKWEADKCSKHHGYRLKGKAGSKRPIPMNTVKPLAARFYRLNSEHTPVGTYLKRFGHRDDDKCWWCGGGSRTAQTWEHLFRHWSRWKDQQKTL